MNFEESKNILYRSLYLLKKKFEIYKNDINKLYTKYFVKDKNNYNNISCKIIKIYSFKSLLEEICNVIYISIFKMNSINELFISNFIPEIKKQERLNEAIDKIYIFITDKIKKYNEIFYNRKLKAAIELKEIEDIADDYTEYYPISEYDKKGNLIYYFEQLKSKNVENELKSNELTLKEEYELNLKEEDILYIDTLPIIIADFINLNPKYVIINNKIDDYELNQEIKNLFDGEILNQMGNKNINLDEKISQLPSYEEQTKIENILKKKDEIDNKIKLYKHLIFQKKKNNENVLFLQVFVDKLNEEKNKYIEELNEEKHNLKQNKINHINNQNKENEELEKYDNEKINEDINNKNDKENFKDDSLQINNLELNKSNISSNKKYILKKNEVDDNLYEIFYFYANHQNKKLNSPTFSRMAFRKAFLNFDEFNKFLNDFSVKIQKEILIELFKRNSTNHYMNFEQFKEIFWKIGLPMNNYRKEKLIKKIQHLKEYINKIKNEDPNIIDKNFLKSKDNKNDISNEFKIEKTENQIKKDEKEYNRLNNLNYDGVINEFDNYIGITEPKIYREKMKGFYNLKERFNYDENGINNDFGKPKLMKLPISHFRIYNTENQSIRNKLIEKRFKTGKKIKLFLKNKINENDNEINQIDNQIKKENEKEIEGNQIVDNSKEDNKELINKNIEFKNKDEIEIKEKEDLEIKKKLEEEENKRKEKQLKEEKERNIYSYNKIEKSALKDIDIDENDEKLKLIDSDSNNSDDEILNRYGNYFNTERQKEIKISKLNDTENENIIENGNENKIKNENIIENENINEKENKSKIENENNNNVNKEEKEKTNNLNKKYIRNNKLKISISVDNKKQIVKNNSYKSPLNSLFKENKKIENTKLRNHLVSSIQRNNEYTSYQKYYNSLIMKNQKDNTLKNAGENIINSNYNSFNDQINSFTNQNRIHTDSNIQLLSNKNSIKLIKTKINNSIKI